MRPLGVSFFHADVADRNCCLLGALRHGWVLVCAGLPHFGSVPARLAPTQQKLEAYECGEPAIGPGSVQFDLRFYVVALLFLIFEVEVAFFFPPATVFGTAVHAESG